MSNFVTCKKFTLEITEGGKYHVAIDDQPVLNVTGFYISGEHAENDLDIDLYQAGADGFMNVINVGVVL